MQVRFLLLQYKCSNMTLRIKATCEQRPFCLFPLTGLCSQVGLYQAKFISFNTNRLRHRSDQVLTTTVKPVNKGYPREILHMVFIDRWSLFGGNFVLFCQRRGIEVWPLDTGWSLFRGGL